MIAKNRKARFNFQVLDEIEAGVVLQGTEVKSLRDGKIQLADAYAAIENGEAFLHHAHIAEWLIAHCGDRAPEFASLIAGHLEQAQKNSQAIVYLRHAGEQAQQTSGFQEAIYFFKRALGLLATTENNEERLQLTREIGRALRFLAPAQR